MSESIVSTQRERVWANWMSVPPVFVVGPARSGTSLMRLMLTAHPAISISSEGAYIYHLRPQLSSYGDLSDPRNLRALHQDIQPILEQERFLSLPPFEDLLDWVGKFGTDVRSIITFYGTWEARVLEKKELAWWGDNAPYHVYHIPFFVSLFPNCKFILMIRDPRDVWASRKTDFPGVNFDQVIGEWQKTLLDGLLAKSHLGSSRVKEVKYESLVTHSEGVLREICEFLQVEYAEEMLDYWQFDAARALAELKHHRNVVKPVFTSSIGRYRETLAREEIDSIEDQLVTLMRYLGYISYEEDDELNYQALDKES